MNLNIRQFFNAAKSRNEQDCVIRCQLSAESYMWIAEQALKHNTTPEDYLHKCLIDLLNQDTAMECLQQAILELSVEAENQSRDINALLKENPQISENPTLLNFIHEFTDLWDSIEKICQEALNGNL